MTTLDKVLSALYLDLEWPDPRTESRVDPKNSWYEALKISRIISNRKVIREISRSPIQWDGKILYTIDASDLLHDTAHFQVATPDRRFEPEYGLGPSPNFLNLDIKLLVSDQERVFEEEMVSLLGIFWEAKLGMHYQYTLARAGWECWEFRDKKAPNPLQQLQNYGLIVDGEPTTMLQT